MNRNRSTALALPAGLILVAGLACLTAGCGESRDSHVREDRIASALPLAPQTSLRIETRTADIHLVPSPDDGRVSSDYQLPLKTLRRPGRCLEASHLGPNDRAGVAVQLLRKVFA